MTSPTAIDFWRQLCVQAFYEDEEANSFILFLEGCKTPLQNSTIYSWTTKNSEYQHNLQRLGCKTEENDTFTLPSEQVTLLWSEKSKARAEWHRSRQAELKNFLKEALEKIHTQPLEANQEVQFMLFEEFVDIHKSDLGSVPFLHRLAGLLKYQLQNRHEVVEWKMSEYILTQNNEAAMESYIRLLKGVLCMELVYKDDNDSETVTIPMDNNQQQKQEEEEPCLVWRMNPNLDLKILSRMLQLLPSVPQTFGEYRVTDIPRTQQEEHKNLFQWIYDLIGYCLSFLHK